MSHQYRQDIADIMKLMPVTELQVLVYHYVHEILWRNHGSRTETAKELKIKIRTMTSRVGELKVLKYPLQKISRGMQPNKEKTMKIGRSYGEKVLRDNKGFLLGVFVEDEQNYVRIQRTDYDRIDYYPTTSFNAARIRSELLKKEKNND